MSKVGKILLIVAGGLILLGCGLFAIIAATNGFNFAQSTDYETKSYEINEVVNKIQIDADISDIMIADAASDYKVEWLESDRATYEVKVEDGTLYISEKKVEKFSFLWFISISGKITVTIPAGIYESLAIDSDTSDVNVTGDLTFKDVSIKLSTGDVNYSAKVQNNLSVKTSTGDMMIKNIDANELKFTASTGKITLEGVKAKSIEASGSTGTKTFKDVDVEGLLKVKSSTGKVILTNVTAGDIDADGDTGKKTFTNTIATNTLTINSSTGDVIFDGVDAQTIRVTTDTGDVKGTLLSAKIFHYQTDTGKVKVPDTETGGSCYITTDTGDITITIK